MWWIYLGANYVNYNFVNYINCVNYGNYGKNINYANNLTYRLR
jgi:hypothetical protein